ncbi:MAG: hypothetical protein N2255_02710 [Kiritimatiellae bacterium]|nr:hypothetical protein [Kiritimatiellia bacterium]
MGFVKNTLPVLIAFVMGLFGMAVYFSPHHHAANFMNEQVFWHKIIGAVTMFIGTYSILRLHYGKIRRRQPGWGYSLVLYVCFAITVAFGIYNRGEGPLAPRPEIKPGTLEGVQWMFNSIAAPASATMFSTLGFFICSAAYRTFRAKTVDAAVLLVAALIVMLGQVPLSALIWEKIPGLSGWLLDVPNMAVKRAIGFGICLGAVGTSLRVMFGLERSYMGGEK